MNGSNRHRSPHDRDGWFREQKESGANGILGVSLAVAHAAAEFCGLPLFRYTGRTRAQVVAGADDEHRQRRHAHADNAVDVQEFMVMPLGFTKFSDALRAGVETFHHLKGVLKAKKLNTNVGDEGGFAPDLRSNAEALDLILEAIQKAGYKPGEQIKIALDVAATELFDEKTKKYSVDGREISSQEMVDFLAGWVAKHPICSIEDGCSEDDWEGWKMLSQRLGDKVQLVGDDLFVTNTKRLHSPASTGTSATAF